MLSKVGSDLGGNGLGPQASHLLFKCSDVKSSRTSWPQGQYFVLVLVVVLEDLLSALASSIVLDMFFTVYLGLVKLFVICLLLVIFLSLQRLDRELNESNDYVTKLTMLSSINLLIVSSV